MNTLMEELRKKYEENVRATDFKTETVQIGSEDSKGSEIEYCMFIVMLDKGGKGFGNTVILSPDLSSELKKQALREMADCVFEKLVEEHGLGVEIFPASEYVMTHFKNKVYGEQDESTKA